MRKLKAGDVVLIHHCEADLDLVGEQATIEKAVQGTTTLYRVVLFDGDNEVQRLVLGQTQFIVLGW